MLGRIAVITLLTMSCAGAQTGAGAPAQSPPSTRPSRPEPPSIQSIVALMREEQWDKATERMDKLCAAIPLDERTRPMALDRAILELRKASTTLRGVKDLSEHLIKHPAEDEPASNILGSLLDASARQNPHARENASWQAAVKEWQRRDQEMDRSHPGWRRWGAKWLTEEEFRAITTEYEQYQARLGEQEDRTDRAQQRYDSLYGRQGSIYPANAPRPSQMSLRSTGSFGHTCGVSRSSILTELTHAGYMPQRPYGNAAAGTSLAQVSDRAKADAQAEQAALAEMICHRPRPEFPAAYGPVDASELTPPPGPKPRVATTAPATQPASAPIAPREQKAPAAPVSPKKVSPDDLYSRPAGQH